MKKNQKYFIYNEDQITKRLVEKIKLPIILIKATSSLQKYNIFSHKLIRLIRRIHLSSFCGFKKIWFKDLKKVNDDETNKILIFSIEEIIFSKILKNNFPKSKKIFWCWNKMSFEKINELRKYYDEIWTFDEEDSKLFDLNFSPQFYWELPSKEKNVKYDISFVGVDKNRLKFLLDIYKYCKQNAINSFFYILKDKKKYSKLNKEILKNKSISYEETVHIAKKSRAILEINKEDQTGLTLRSLEALFFNKKLITNNKNIQQYEFYNENNIYILTSNNLNGIKKFLDKEKNEINEEIKQKYYIDSWLKKILGEVQC